MSAHTPHQRGRGPERNRYPQFADFRISAVDLTGHGNLLAAVVQTGKGGCQ